MRRRMGEYALTDDDRTRGIGSASLAQQLQAALSNLELSQHDLETLFPDYAPTTIRQRLWEARQDGRIISVAAPDAPNQQGSYGARRYRAVREEE